MINPLTRSNLKQDWDGALPKPEPELHHLIIAWSREQPYRLGEAAPIEGRCILARGTPEPGDTSPHARFYRQRPWELVEMPPLQGASISRRQLELSPLPDGGLEVRSVGRCPLILHGEVVRQGIVRPGDTITLQNELLLFVVWRRQRWDPLATGPATAIFPFGEADPHGLVGESPATWRLRHALRFAAQAGYHVLVHGESGAGKELAARAIHALSRRMTGAFVARNAATFPEGLIDAELFGNARGYPHAGSPERPGVIGEADGGTLFLDEIGELPQDLQAHLLRVMDRHGEYQRLGEARPRCANLRVVAATNRPIEALKHDLAARLPIRVEVPGLEPRREDIPLLIWHLLAAAGRDHPGVAPRFFERCAGAPDVPRIDPRVIDALLRHRYTHHLRELQRLLWLALSTSPERFVGLTPELRAELRLGTPAPEPRASEPSYAGHEALPGAGHTDPATLGRAEVEAALASSRGKIAPAARRLGLKDRFALYRLMKRLGLAEPDDSGMG